MRSFARIKAQDIADHIKRLGIEEADLLLGSPSGAWNFITVPILSFENRPTGGPIAIGADRVAYPDLETARIDTLRSPATLSLICDDESRNVAKRAEAFLRESGVADRATFGTIPTFCTFERSAPVAAENTLALRSDIALALRQWDVGVLAHASGSHAAQAELQLGAVSLLKAADDLLALKYATKAIAAKHGLRASFMPKPFFDRPGSGMPCRISLAKNGRALFYDASGYANCSQTMLWFAGGLLAHAGSLLAFTAPTTNSYKRYAAGDGPRTIAFSARNGMAAVDVGGHDASDPKGKFLEFRPADAAVNPYLGFAALLLAGLDGIKQKIDPIRAGFGPLDIDLATLPPQERSKLRTIPPTLREAIAALAADNAYLTEGGVFTAAILSEWIAFKTNADLGPSESRPTPLETELYLDC